MALVVGTLHLRGNGSIPESVALGVTAERNPSDRSEMAPASSGDISVAEVSRPSLASDDGSVATDIAFVAEVSSQPLDSAASLLDGAQVLWSQSVSAFRSQVFNRKRSVDPKADARELQPSTSQRGFSDDGQSSEGFIAGCSEHETLQEAAIVPTEVVELIEATVPAVGHAAQTVVEDASATSADGGVPEDNAPVAEATCQQANKSASLVDHAQLIWSQSLSAVRSTVPRGIKCLAANSADSNSEADTVARQGASPESVTSADVIRRNMPEAGTSAPLQTEESNSELEAAAGLDDTPSTDGGADASVVSTHSSAAGHSYPCMETTLPTVRHAAQTIMAEASGASGASADCGVPADNSSVAETIGQQADKGALLVDRAQVLWSQSLSALRSTIPQRIKDPAANSADTNLDASAALPQAVSAEAVASAGAGSYNMPEAGTCASLQTLESDGEVEMAAGLNEELAADGGADALAVSTDASTATHSDPSQEATAPAVDCEAQIAMAETSDGVVTANSRITKDNAAAAEAICQQADKSALLVDRAQVFWSQSLSAVRSTVPQHIKYLAANLVDTNLDADLSPPQEATDEAVTSVGVLRYDMPEAGSPTSLRTLESNRESETSAGLDAEPRPSGGAVDSMRSLNFSAATHSGLGSISPCEQTFVEATQLDQAQVFASSVASTLRSQVSALVPRHSVVSA